MGAIQNILFSLLALAIAFGFQTYRNLTKPFPKPELGKLKKYLKKNAQKQIWNLNLFFVKNTLLIRWQKKRVQTFKYLVSDLKEYWGRGDGKNYKEDQALRPFKISYSDEVGKSFSFYSPITSFSFR